MANKIVIDQQVILNFTDTDGTDMDTVDFRVDYWAPANQTDTPTGTVAAAQIATTPGSSIVIITVLKNILSTPSNKNLLWRFQIIDNITGVAWTTMCFAVKNKGTC